MDLGDLISEIMSPPMERVGIMELESFFPKKDRQELAMTLNNLLASPSFSSWLDGEPLDVKRMLHTSEGKPCVSIVFDFTFERPGANVLCHDAAQRSDQLDAQSTWHVQFASNFVHGRSVWLLSADTESAFQKNRC